MGEGADTMIIGVGTDIVGLERIGKMIEGANGEAFLRRVLTEAERRLLEERQRGRARTIEFVAGRWAAKEAVSKALGCGIGGRLGFRDVEVLPDASGKPGCVVSEQAWARLGRRARVHLSISHADGWATAFAVAEAE